MTKLKEKNVAIMSKIYIIQNKNWSKVHYYYIIT